MGQEETIIELPQGNHLLGFKEDKRPSRQRLWLILAISLAACAMAVFFFARYIIDSIVLPPKTVAWALVRGGTELPTAFPQVWKTAAAETRLPVILGMVKDERGWIPYALTNRRNPNHGFLEYRSGPFVILSDRNFTEALQPEPKLLRQAGLSLLKHPAYIVAELKHIDPSLELTVKGPLGAQGWQTDLPVADSAVGSPQDKDTSINLDVWPQAWPMIHDELSLRLNGAEVMERPTYISWSVATDTEISIDLGYSQAPATSTIYGLAGALGLHDEKSMDLPDGSSLIELRWPINKLEGQDFDRSKPGLTILSLNGEKFHQIVPFTADSDSFCKDGIATAYFSNKTIAQVTGLSSNTLPRGLALSNIKGFLNLCW
jgi:hypothetical protein